MKILVLNCGSSSAKYQLFFNDNENWKVEAKGVVEKIGLHGSFLKQSGFPSFLDIEVHSHNSSSSPLSLFPLYHTSVESC